jgi:integrative and conjugative element protein (TIGR02256 family)
VQSVTTAGRAVHEHWTLLIQPRALDAIAAEVSLGGIRLETGGILLGSDDPINHTTTITDAGGPGPNAVREAARFSRDRRHAELLAQRAWESHRAQWVGEWHTHTRDAPAPSNTDIATYAGHLRDPELGFDRFVALIAAVRSDQPAVLVAWIVDVGTVRQVPLRSIQEDTNAGNL